MWQQGEEKRENAYLEDVQGRSHHRERSFDREVIRTGLKDTQT